MKEYYQKNKEKISKKHKQYREDNLEKELKQRKIYYQCNKEKISGDKKQYYKNNREVILKYNKQWYKNNPEKKEEYYKNNKERIDEQHKKWYMNNLEERKKRKKQYRKSDEGKAANQRGHMRRHLKETNMINTLTAQEWENILSIFNNHCAYCGCEFTDKNKPARDHIIPISKGGHNVKENIVPACQSCNSRKYNKILIGGTYDFRRKIRRGTRACFIS